MKNDIQIIDVTGAAAILKNQQQQQQVTNHSDNTSNNDNEIDANQKALKTKSKKNEIIENKSLNNVTAASA